MQIVINIPEEEYKCVQITGCIGNKTCISNAIYNGTPLPKGHGRLIDEKVAYRKFYARCLAKAATEVFAETPTVIEADKESEEKDV